MRHYIPLILAVGFVYALNRFCLVPATTGAIHDLLAWHGADVLAGALMLCVLNCLLTLTRRPPVRGFWTATVFLLGCGLFWEAVTPLYLSRSVGDPWDVLAYWLGGMAMLLIESKRPST